MAALVLVGIPYGALTFHRGFDWKSNLTLFEHEYRNRPCSVRSLGNYAKSLEEVDTARAVRVYLEAVALAPDYVHARRALGTLLVKRGESARAVEQVAAADRLQPGDPSTLLNLGAAYAQLRRWDDAEQCWRRVLELDPTNSKARLNLARLAVVRER